MEAQWPENGLSGLIHQYDYHNELYKRSLEGITAEHAHYRVNNVTNHIAWMAGNLVGVRYKLAHGLGFVEEQRFPQFFKNNKSLMPHSTYPDLKEIIDDWDRITPKLSRLLRALTNEQLAAASLLNTPYIKQPDLRGAISFIINREAYVIGQINLIRKAVDYASVSYNISIH